MHFFYTDESGDTGKNLTDPDQPIFVMGGISLRDEGWNKTHEELTAILNTYFHGEIPEQFELHAHEMLSPSGSGPFSGHPMAARTKLAEDILALIVRRKHGVHFVAFHKPSVKKVQCGLSLAYNPSMPYLLGFDYLVTYVNWYTKEKLGRSARALMILDEKQQHRDKIVELLHERRFRGAVTKRVKWIVDVTYSVDSARNPMIQLSDLVIFCVRRFLEIEHGYRDAWPDAAKQFYARAYSNIEARLGKKSIVPRDEAKLRRLDEYLEEVRCKPVGRYKARYGL